MSCFNHGVRKKDGGITSCCNVVNNKCTRQVAPLSPKVLLSAIEF